MKQEKEFVAPVTECSACNAPLWANLEEGPDVPHILQIDGISPCYNGFLMICSQCMIDYQKTIPEKWVKIFEERECKFLIPNAIRLYHRENHDKTIPPLKCKFCEHARSIWRKFYNIPEND